jgi:hypothetical protein
MSRKKKILNLDLAGKFLKAPYSRWFRAHIISSKLLVGLDS